MALLLNELLHDAERRAAEIAREFAGLKSQIPAEVESYRDKMEKLAVRSRDIVTKTLNDPDLNKPILAVNYYRDYKDVARLVQSLDHPLLVLRRFGDDDLWMTRVLAKICDEIAYPFDTPVCSAISSQYYWTVADMDLVFVPSLEPGHLLALADMYHELGHILLYRKEARFVFPGLSVVDKHFDQLVASGKKANWAAESLKEVEAFRGQWKTSWLIEFGADLIATYTIGPAFGWCNIRTSTNLGGELFVGSESHPADDARATAIAFMLRRVGQGAAAAEVAARWSELVNLSAETPPPRYDLAYPKGLLEDLVELCHKECTNLGLRVWGNASPDSVGGLVDGAWAEFRRNPETFGTNEKQQLGRLEAILGVKRS